MKYVKPALLVFMLSLTASCSCTAQEGRSLYMKISDYDEQMLRPAIEEFEELYPEVELRVEVYSASELGFIAGVEKMAAELMAGSGPDIMIGKTYGTNDVKKLMKAGVLAPLDELMEADPLWKKEDYLMSVLDCGKFDGMQYLLPLTYQAFYAISSEEAMAEIGMSEESCPDVLSYMQLLEGLYDTDYKSRILSDAGQLAFFPQLIGADFLDYENGTIGVDADLLREACEAYARMFEEDSLFPDSFYENYYWAFGDDILQRNSYCFTPRDIYAALDCAAVISAKETPAVLPFRNSEGKTVGQVVSYAGIRANSPNKEAAWNMLRCMLGYETQMEQAYGGGYCPVSREAFDEVFESFLLDAQYDSPLPVGAIPEEFLEDLKECVTTPEKCVFVSSMSVLEFYNAMTPYYTGKSSYEECLDEFERFIRIYLTE